MNLRTTTSTRVTASLPAPEAYEKTLPSGDAFYVTQITLTVWRDDAAINATCEISGPAVARSGPSVLKCAEQVRNLPASIRREIIASVNLHRARHDITEEVL